MSRTVSWVINAGLLVLCCYLVANTANAVFASVLTPTPDQTLPPAASRAPVERTWADRQAIVDRNLFGSDLVTATVPVIDEFENLKETGLPLELVGTLATSDPEDPDAVATILDKDSQETLSYRVGDSVRNGAATVERIERKRIVLLERGEPRELSLDEDETMASVQPTGRAARRAAARPVRPRARRRAAARPRTENLDEAIRRPAEIFSQANMRPKYESGQIVGVEVSSVKAGSDFEKAGIHDGDLITGLNGISIDSPEQSAKLLMELANSDSWNITFVDSEGNEQSVEVQPEE
jgi:general secretion pathway protein C